MQKEIDRTLNTLKLGGTILYPTDTIWGIGCDATNIRAIQKINQIKKREYNKSQLILLESIDSITDYVKKVPESAIEMINQTSQPLTIIYPEAKNLPVDILGEDGSIAIRIVKNEFCKKLIKTFGKPITSTSANFANETAPLYFKEISEIFKGKIDYVVSPNYEDKTPNKASKIVKVELSGEISVIRE